MAVERQPARDENPDERFSLHPLKFEEAVKHLFKRKPRPVEEHADEEEA